MSLEEYLKGVEPLVGPLFDEMAKEWSALDADKHEEFRMCLFDELFCHASLPKIRGNRVATRVGDVYARGIYPTYTR